MEQMGEEEKARVEAQRASLGSEGLEKCRVTLEEATENNEVCERKRDGGNWRRPLLIMMCVGGTLVV